MITIRSSTALLVLALLAHGASPCQAQDQPSDPLQPFAHLVGGTWHGAGTWPDGSPLNVAITYFWGPTKRVLHFETNDLTGEGRAALLYEGFLFFDTRRNQIVQYNIKPTGEVSEQAVASADSTGYEINSPQTRSSVRFTNADAFVWELRVPEGDQWTLIMTAVHRRRP